MIIIIVFDSICSNCVKANLNLSQGHFPTNLLPSTSPCPNYKMHRLGIKGTFERSKCNSWDNNSISGVYQKETK